MVEFSSKTKIAVSYNIYVAVVMVLALFGLFGFGAASISANVDLYQTYGGLFAALAVVALALEGFGWREKYFEVIIYESENSPILEYAPQFRNPITQLFLGLLLASISGLIAITFPEIVAGVPQMSVPFVAGPIQGFLSKNIGILLIYMFPAGPAENFAILQVVMSFGLLSGLKFIFTLFDIDIDVIREDIFVFLAVGILLAVVGAYAGLILHNFVGYLSNEKTSTSVWFFWFLIVFLWWITQSILASETYHLGNNAIEGIKKIYASLDLQFILIIAIFFLFIIFGYTLSKNFQEIWERVAS